MTEGRADWGQAPSVRFSLMDLTALVQPAFPGQTVTESEPTRGGLANTNLRLWLSQEAHPVRLRLFTRSPEAGRKETALSRLVTSRTLVPKSFYFADSNPLTRHPYALLEWIDGTRLEVAVRSLPAEQIVRLGRSVGGVLAGVHSITFQQTGFFDAGLRVAHPLSVGSAGLTGYLHQCLVAGRGQGRIGRELTQEALAFVAREGGLLDTWDGPPCLAHGDFGGSNILVRETAGEWEVAAVLDWEFAFSGSPFFDLGNLLRPPLGEVAGFAQAVQEGYMETGGALPPQWLQMSRLVDLLSWADFLDRPEANAALVRDAAAAITGTITEWNHEDCRV